MHVCISRSTGGASRLRSHPRRFSHVSLSIATAEGVAVGMHYATHGDEGEMNGPMGW